MGSLKIMGKVCAQDLRKWRTDYRIWVIAVLAVSLVGIYIDDLQRIADGLGTELSVWIYPFLYSQFHMKLIFTLPLVLLFCDAPFIDQNQTFVYLRTGRSRWLGGQLAYIAAAGAVYYGFLFAACFLGAAAAGGSIHLEWGKLLSTTANSNAAMYFGSPFVMVSGLVVRYFTPPEAVWFTFLLSWLCAVMIGTMIFFCNLLTGTKGLGITLTSLLIVLSALADNGFPSLLPFSPISWNTLEHLDVGGRTSNPTFGFCVGVYLALIAAFTAGIMVFGKNRNLTGKGQ